MPEAKNSRKRALIIGAGPAGLTAAYELLTRTNIDPVILEMSGSIGGLSRTVNYKGNRIDIGGHRFFSKSDRVMNWWLNMLALETAPGLTTKISYRGQDATLCSVATEAKPGRKDPAMLIRNRQSHVYFMGQLFEYPIQLTTDTLKKLGLRKVIRVGLSYLHSLLFPIRDESNLEQFLINRFGRELYVTFFKTYTEKVWGTDCKEISAEWGVQRIKGLSLYKLIGHLLETLCRNYWPSFPSSTTETSLIEHFLYPRLGPGQMWEEVAKRVRNLGGDILMERRVDKIEHHDFRSVVAVCATNLSTGQSQRFEVDYVFSTMPVKELVAAMLPTAPQPIREISDGLLYRDFMTVGVLCKRLKLRDASGGLIKDNWIYIQDPGVLLGRLQIFNNWSPALVADPSTIWIGLEYFCNETDEVWRKSDGEMIELAKAELAAIGVLDPCDVLDATVIRMPKAYPAYFGSYSRFHEVSAWSDQFENLFLIGRNGMHKYNNQDHSMLTAMTAVDNIVANTPDRGNLWALNAEQEYHEQKHSTGAVA